MQVSFLSSFSSNHNFLFFLHRRIDVVLCWWWIDVVLCTWWIAVCPQLLVSVPLHGYKFVAISFFFYLVVPANYDRQLSNFGWNVIMSYDKLRMQPIALLTKYWCWIAEGKNIYPRMLSCSLYYILNWVHYHVLLNTGALLWRLMLVRCCMSLCHRSP